MHTFGHPADVKGLTTVADKWRLTLVGDASESLAVSILASIPAPLDPRNLKFNDNKIITTGGGGMILTSLDLERESIITTTAKMPHPYEYIHDEVAFNYRLPNLMRH